MSIVEGMRYFYLIGAILLLAVSILVYPTLRKKSHR